jgi:glycosyltransferase involved in cell wall biosynthesis
MTPVVSVLVPTYRRPGLLRRTLASLTSQRAEGFSIEVWVYDNASGDETEQVVRRAGTSRVPVHYVRRAENIGSTLNFTGAIRDVRSPFFAVISDDDVLLDGALQGNVSSLLAHPEASAWNGVVLAGSAQRLVGYRPAPQWPMGLTDGPRALDLISRNIRPETTGMVFRRDVVDDQFCPDDGTFTAQDLLWLCRAASKGGIGVSPEPSGILYVHAASLSSSGGAAQAVSILFPSIPLLCDRLQAWELPEPLRSRVVRQFQAAYGEHGLTLIAYRAVLDDDAEGLAVVQRTVAAHRWLSAVGGRLAWARRASRLRVRLALLGQQVSHGNPRHKLVVLWWRWFRWARYRPYVQGW